MPRVALALVGMLAGIEVGAAEPMRIRIGVEAQTPPLSFLDAQGAPSGFTAELLREAGKAGGVEFDLVPSTWGFIDQEFRAGRIDALANVAITRERRTTMEFSVGHAYLHAITFTRRGADPVRHTRDLAGKSIAIVPGSLIDLNAREQGAWGGRLVSFPSRQATLDAVRNGECDVAVHLLPTRETKAAERELRTSFVRDLRYHFHVAVRRGDTARLHEIDKALNLVLRNGTFDRLYSQWIGPIEPHPIRLIDLRPYLWPLVAAVSLLVGLFLWQQRIIAHRRRAEAALLETVAERERAEVALRESRAETVAVMNSTTDLIWSVDPVNFGLVTYNKAFEEFLRRDRGAAIRLGMTADDVTSPESAAHWRSMYVQALREGSFTCEYTPQTTSRVLWVSINPMKRGDEVFGISVFGRDITELKRLAESLRESDSRFRLLIRSLHAGVVLYDATARITFCNAMATELLGVAESDLLGQSTPTADANVTHEDGTPFTADALPAARAFASRQPVRNVVMGVYNPSRRRRTWLLASAEALPGDPLQVLCVFHDITQLKLTEARLHLQGAALEAAANMVMITDATGAIEWVNPAFTRCTGYELDEIIGQNPRFMKSAKQPPGFYADLWRTIVSGQSWSGKLVNTRKDGSLYTEESTITPVRDQSGAITHFVAVKQDITERESLEKQLYETQRLESIGLLASGIAHDLNNILAPIVLSMELLRAEFPDEARTLEMVEQCARRGADIVRQVLTFSRGMDGTRLPLKVTGLIREMGHLMSETLPRQIEITYDLTATEDTARVDPTQIHQVLLNLAVNARDAMPKGGRLSFTLTNEAVAEGDPQLVVGVRPGTFVVIGVSDTGMGIPPDVLPRIFEPFYSTKPRGQGTGLGLSTVHGIVRGHGGFIQVKSDVGIGTTFRVFLPVDGQRESVAASAPALTGVRGEGRSILIADDEPMIRAATRQVLERHGFQTTVASDGNEAVELFRARRTEFALVLLDRMMPGMNGENAAHIIHHLEPKVPIILATGLVTGGSLAEQESTLQQAGVVAVLRKPFAADQLLSVLADHL